MKILAGNVSMRKSVGLGGCEDVVINQVGVLILADRFGDTGA